MKSVWKVEGYFYSGNKGESYIADRIFPLRKFVRAMEDVILGVAVSVFTRIMLEN